MSKPSSRPRHTLAYAALARGAGTVLAARIVGVGLSYVLQVLLARWAGPAHYGAYSYAMAWAALLATFGGLGLPQAIVRFIPEYYSTQEWGLLRGAVRHSERAVFGTSCMLAALGGTATVLLTPFDALTRCPLLLGLALVPGLALLRLQTEMCIARQQVRMAYVLPNLLRPLTMIGGAALGVLWLDVHLTSTTAVLLAAVPVLPIWGLQRWTFRRDLPDAFQTTSPAYATGTWLRTAMPMLLITGFLLVLGQTDLVMIGLFMDTEQVGLYKVAAKTAILVLFPLFAVNAVVAPRFAELYTHGDHAMLQRLASTAAHWIFWSSLAGALFLFVASGFILGLFGTTFLQAEKPLMILIAGQLINAGAGPVGPLLLMTGHQQAGAKVYGVCALLNIGLNVAGIYFLGIVGAAAATALSTLLWNVGLYRLVVAKLGVYPSALDALRTLRPSHP